MIRWFRALDAFDKQGGFVLAVLVGAFVVFAVVAFAFGESGPILGVLVTAGLVAFVGGLFWLASRLFPRDPS